MSYDLGSYDPASGAVIPAELGGFSLKSVGKVVKKAVAPVKGVVKVASAVGVPGAGFVNAAVNSGIGKKVTTATKKVETAKKMLAPPKPPPKPLPKPTLIATSNSRRKPMTSGVPASTAKPKTLQQAKHVIVKHATNEAAKKVAPNAKVKGGKISTLPVQAHAAGIKFRKKAKKGGGTEIVPTDANGAVVGPPVPASTLERTGTPIESGPVLPVNAVQAAPPPVPSAAEAQNMINAAVAQSVPDVAPVNTSGGGGGGGGGFFSPSPAPNLDGSSPAPSLFSNPLVLAGGAAAALLIVPSLLGGRR